MISGQMFRATVIASGTLLAVYSATPAVTARPSVIQRYTPAMKLAAVAAGQLAGAAKPTAARVAEVAATRRLPCIEFPGHLTSPAGPTRRRTGQS